MNTRQRGKAGRGVFFCMQQFWPWTVIVPAAAFFLLVIAGCGSWEKTGVAPRKPDMLLTVGYLDLTSHQGRIERRYLATLSGILKKEKVDVLGVTGITRYPGVATRTDFVDVLSSLSEMRAAFGLASDVSGRQKGNAVFSVYPLSSSTNIPFDDGGDTDGAAALLARVDCGLTDVQFVAMKIPSAGSSDLQKTLAATEASRPLLLLGNFAPPPPQEFRSNARENGISSFWIRNDVRLELMGERTLQSAYGHLKVVTIALFHLQK